MEYGETDIQSRKW